MWSTKSREDVELLELFEQSGRNVQRASALLRDLFADYPERPELATEVLACENEADRIVRAAVASLFATGIDPKMVIRWKDIFDTLESAVDACETVANVLEGITLKRTANGRH